MTGYHLLILILMGWALREVVLGIVVFRQRKSIRHKWRVECTQRQFAEARNKLMEAALAGELDSNSATFQFFYWLNTRMMRRPDEYEQISALLRETVLSWTRGSNESDLARETRDWSDSTRGAVTLTAFAIHMLVIDYSLMLRSFMRLYFYAGKCIPKAAMHRIQVFAEQAGEKMSRKRKVVADINHTQRALNKLAMA